MVKNPVSIFNKLNRTSTPDNQQEVNDLLLEIRDGSQKMLVKIARQFGKGQTTNIENGFVFVDADQVRDYRHPALLAILEEEVSKGNKIIWFSLHRKQNELLTMTQSGQQVRAISDIETFLQKIADAEKPSKFLYTINRKHKLEDGSFAYLPDCILQTPYNYIKSNLLKVVTWNILLGEKQTRNLKSECTFSGFMYMDIDDFTGTSVDRVIETLTDNQFTFVKAVWRSVGYDGIGFLIAVDGLNRDNFEITWRHYQERFKNELGLTIDKATKDFTRINVLSSDETAFIREKTEPLSAINKTVERVVIQNATVTDEESCERTRQVLKNIYDKPEYYNRQEDRFSYSFYQVFFSICNQKGIPFDSLWACLLDCEDRFPKFLNNRKYTETEIKDIGVHQYDVYADQHGFQTIDPSYFDQDGLYTVIGQGIPYNGDNELKIKSILKKSNSELDESGMAKIAIRCKRAGILRNSLLEYFETHYPSMDFESVIKSVYNTDRYPFGVQMILNELKVDGFLKQQDEFYDKRGYRRIAVDYKENPNHREEILLEAEQRESENDAVLEKYFKFCYQKQIDKKQAHDFVATRFNERLVRFYSEEAYNGLNPLKGWYYIRNEQKQGTIFTLPNDKKLSELNFPLKENCIFWADTNMGKTTLICKKLTGKRIILVPVISSLMSIENQHGASVFYEDKKNVKETDELIVCTYSSFPSLFNMIQTWNTPCQEWDLYVDEQHNFAASASPSFRGKEMNFILDNMHFFKTVRMFTGTHVDNLHPKLVSMDLVRVKWEKQPEKKYKVIYYKDKLAALEERLVPGKKNLIYLQNKKSYSKLGELVSFLNKKGWNNIQIINADEKNEIHFKHLVKEEHFLGNPEIIICTSVMIEAINILDKDVETVHFLTRENPNLMEQLVNRPRLKLPEMIYFYWVDGKKKKEDNRLKDFDSKKFQNAMIEKAQGILKYMAKPKNKKNNEYNEVVAQKIFMNNMMETAALFRATQNGWEIDYLAIANQAFNLQKKAANEDITYLKSILNQYGWTFQGVEFDTTTRDMFEKQETTEEMKGRKEEFLAECDIILETAHQEGLEHIKKVVTEKRNVFTDKNYPDAEWDIRLKYLKFSKFMSVDDAKTLTGRWMLDGKMDKRNYQSILRQIAAKQATNLNVLRSSIKLNHNFSIEMFKFYEKYKGKILSVKMMEENFTKIRVHSPPILQSEYVKVFELYFELIPVLKNAELHYKIGGINQLVDATIFENRIRTHYETEMRSNTTLLPLDVCKTLNRFRRDLPFLSKIPLTQNQGISRLKDCFELKKTTKRVDGKHAEAYRIIANSPSFMEGITII